MRANSSKLPSGSLVVNIGVGKMKTVIVKFDNGDSITTGINGTDEEIRDYYRIGTVFNLGDGAGGDLMSSVVSVEFLEEAKQVSH